ncbi:efflux RND transporter periplasmic adaptor subunit [Glaciecola sp. SC05]|uniref:efflux RND transporter periplasmic adaptor subunit n=1 Tax=Glaciecola sp. SC05 TaxID=1987355 RepID=UPI00352783D7
MVQFKRWMITIVSLLCIIGILGFIKYNQVMAGIAFGASFPEPSETVQTISVTPSVWRPSLRVIGEVKAQRSVELRNEFEGIITKVAFASGGKVSQGDLLVQLDIAPELAQLEAINAEIALAKLDVKRASDLLEVRASSREQLDRANSQLMINQARARALQANIDRKTIRAPFTGIASIHDWEVGTYIAANSVITTIVGDLSKVWVDFSIPQWQADITIGSEVKISSPELKNGLIPAKISAVNQQIASASRSVMVRAELDNTEQRFKPGSVVSVLFPIEQAQTVYAVPNEALRFDSFGSFVFKLVKDDKGDYRATRQPVSFAAREDKMALLTSGVTSTDVIATIGSAKLSEGLLVYAAQEQ